MCFLCDNWRLQKIIFEYTARPLMARVRYVVAAVTTSFGVERRVKEGKAKVNVCVLHDKRSQISITLSTTICVHPLWHIFNFFVQKFFNKSPSNYHHISYLVKRIFFLQKGLFSLSLSDLQELQEET